MFTLKRILNFLIICLMCFFPRDDDSCFPLWGALKICGTRDFGLSGMGETKNPRVPLGKPVSSNEGGALIRYADLKPTLAPWYYVNVSHSPQHPTALPAGTPSRPNELAGLLQLSIKRWDATQFRFMNGTHSSVWKTCSQPTLGVAEEEYWWLGKPGTYPTAASRTTVTGTLRWQRAFAIFLLKMIFENIRENWTKCPSGVSWVT